MFYDWISLQLDAALGQNDSEGSFTSPSDSQHILKNIISRLLTQQT